MSKEMRKFINAVENADNSSMKRDFDNYLMENNILSEWRDDPIMDPSSPEYQFEVVKDPKIQFGHPTIKGTRWLVRHLAELGINDGVEATVKSYRGVTREMVEKSIEYLREHPNI